MTFPYDEYAKQLPDDQKPFSIVGTFYHSHENEEKWHRNEFGSWSLNKNDNKNLDGKTEYPRVKNGKVFPLKFRHLYTVEEVLKAKNQREEANMKARNIGAFAAKKIKKRKVERNDSSL